MYRALTSDAKLGHDWVDLLTTKSILLRLVSVRGCTYAYAVYRRCRSKVVPVSSAFSFTASCAVVVSDTVRSVLGADSAACALFHCIAFTA
jgi:hypothetical protein